MNDEDIDEIMSAITERVKQNALEMFHEEKKEEEAKVKLVCFLKSFLDYAKENIGLAVLSDMEEVSFTGDVYKRYYYTFQDMPLKITMNYKKDSEELYMSLMIIKLGNIHHQYAIYNDEIKYQCQDEDDENGLIKELFLTKR